MRCVRRRIRFSLADVGEPCRKLGSGCNFQKDFRQVDSRQPRIHFVAKSD